MTAKKIVLIILVGSATLALWYATKVYIRSRPHQPTPVDIVVLDSTLSLLDHTSWSRSDDRKCRDTTDGYTLFCALKESALAVRGDFHPRMAALEEIRNAIDRYRPEHDYQHRLGDFNADSMTTMTDMQFVILEARKVLVAGFVEP